MKSTFLFLCLLSSFILTPNLSWSHWLNGDTNSNTSIDISTSKSQYTFNDQTMCLYHGTPYSIGSSIRTDKNSWQTCVKIKHNNSPAYWRSGT